MLSNSKVVFDQLARTLVRAGLFISFADTLEGRNELEQKKARMAEAYALYYLMRILQEQHSEEGFLDEIAKIAEGELQGVQNLSDLGPDDIENIQNDLRTVPQELEDTITLALDNFEKREARLYADIVMSACGSVGKAYDEKDEYTDMGGGIEDAFMWTANIKHIFYRILMKFEDLHQDDVARYLYNENNIFDQMKISTKESDAIGKLAGSIKAAWLKKHPEDMNQTVQEYLEEMGQKDE